MKLGIPGEFMRGVFGGREIVQWYNSFMDYDLDIDLSSVETLAIIGY